MAKGTSSYSKPHKAIAKARPSGGFSHKAARKVQGANTLRPVKAVRKVARSK